MMPRARRDQGSALLLRPAPNAQTGGLDPGSARRLRCCYRRPQFHTHGYLTGQIASICPMPRTSLSRVLLAIIGPVGILPVGVAVAVTVGSFVYVPPEVSLKPEAMLFLQGST